METTFSESLRDKTLFGPILTQSSSAMVEVAATAGFGWLFIDAEHAPLGPDAVQTMLAVVGSKVRTVVRIPENSALCVKQFVDLGCDGIMIPQIRVASDAQRAVAAAKYPPLGQRSVGIARAHGFGMNFASYVRDANAHLSIIVQAEHIDAVNNIDEILGIEGIDAIFIGPYDLSGSMGMLGEVAHPQVCEAINKVKRCCERRKVPIGIFAGSIDQALKYSKEGYDFIAVGIDIMYLGRAYGDALVNLRT